MATSGPAAHADDAGLARPRRQRVGGHLVARLRHAVALDHRRAEHRFEVAHHLRRQGRRGGAEEAQRHPRDDLAVALRPRQDRLVHGRHRRVPGGPLRIEPAEEAQRVEARRADHRRRRPRASARVAAISPWMWNSGITFRQASSGESSRVRAMLPAEAVTLPWVSGTIFGRAVVPEVCSTSATSSVSGRARPRRLGPRRAPPSRVKQPAPPPRPAPAPAPARPAAPPPPAPASRRRAARPAPAPSGRSGRTRTPRPCRRG